MKFGQVNACFGQLMFYQKYMSWYIHVLLQIILIHGIVPIQVYLLYHLEVKIGEFIFNQLSSIDVRHIMRKPTTLTRSDTNRAVLPQKMAKGRTFAFKK